MPHFTIDQIKQQATHLCQESIRLRKSNPELAAMAKQDAGALQKITAHREKHNQQDYPARLKEAHDDADFDARAETPARGAPSAGVDPAAQEQPGTVRDGTAARGVLPEEGRGRGTAD